MTAYDSVVRGFEMGSDAVDALVTLENSLFQTGSEGMGFSEIHIGWQFDIKVGFQEAADLADMDVMGVDTLQIGQIMNLIDDAFTGGSGWFNMNDHIDFALW